MIIVHSHFIRHSDWTFFLILCSFLQYFLSNVTHYFTIMILRISTWNYWLDLETVCELCWGDLIVAAGRVEQDMFTACINCHLACAYSRETVCRRQINTFLLANDGSRLIEEVGLFSSSFFQLDGIVNWSQSVRAFFD